MACTQLRYPFYAYTEVFLSESQKCVYDTAEKYAKNDSKVKIWLGVFMLGVANLWSTVSDALWHVKVKKLSYSTESDDSALFNVLRIFHWRRPRKPPYI